MLAETMEQLNMIFFDSLLKFVLMDLPKATLQYFKQLTFKEMLPFLVVFAFVFVAKPLARWVNTITRG